MYIHNFIKKILLTNALKLGTDPSKARRRICMKIGNVIFGWAFLEKL